VLHTKDESTDCLLMLSLDTVYLESIDLQVCHMFRYYTDNKKVKVKVNL
jgi:hypothetical protein